MFERGSGADCRCGTQQVHGREPEFHIFIPKGLSHSPKAAPPPHTDLQAPGTSLDRAAVAKLNLDSAFPGRPRVKSVKVQIL